MAEAMLNHFARELGIDAEAESAGTLGGSALNPVAVQAMAEIEISMDGQHPKVLTQEMADRADRIISMSCGVDAEACPARFLLTEDWKLEDPAGQPIEKVREIRDQIRTRVLALLEQAVSKSP